MNRRVLHVLSQRPGFTGSGITVAALVREAARHGWAQRVVAVWLTVTGSGQGVSDVTRHTGTVDDDTGSPDHTGMA